MLTRLGTADSKRQDELQHFPSDTVSAIHRLVSSLSLRREEMHALLRQLALADWSRLTVKSSHGNDAESLCHTVTLTVSNSGTVAGRDVVQIYVADPKCSVRRPRKELKGFAKTAVLSPGETENVSVELDKLAFSFYDDQLGKWVVERGDFYVLVARSSTDITMQARVTIAQTVTWTGL